MAAEAEPLAVVTGPVDGNVFAVLGACSRALKRAGHAMAAKELAERVFASSSYAEALAICQEYVEFDL